MFLKRYEIALGDYQLTTVILQLLLARLSDTDRDAMVRESVRSSYPASYHWSTIRLYSSVFEHCVEACISDNRTAASKIRICGPSASSFLQPTFVLRAHSLGWMNTSMRHAKVFQMEDRTSRLIEHFLPCHCQSSQSQFCGDIFVDGLWRGRKVQLLHLCLRPAMCWWLWPIPKYYIIPSQIQIHMQALRLVGSLLRCFSELEFGRL